MSDALVANAPEVAERSRVEDVAAWNVASLNEAGSIHYSLSAKEVDALRLLIGRTAHIPTQSTTREHYQQPALEGCMQHLKDELLAGRGVVVIAGIDPTEFTPDEQERLFWAFGTHLGIAAVQSASGDRIGHVRAEAVNPKNRGYMSDRELGLHSDAYEIVGLMCLQPAAEGGDTRLASGLAIHNEMLLRSPHLLPALYRGYPYATAEAAGAKSPVTPYPVPVFSERDGKTSCMCLSAYMHSAAERLGTRLPDDLVQALNKFFEIGNSPDFCFQFPLRPGEMLFCNNFVLLHARTAFRNSETHQRHVLRLWLKVPDGRPVVRPLIDRGEEYERLYSAQASPN